jgi:hypothetical protein
MHLLAKKLWTYKMHGKTTIKIMEKVVVILTLDQANCVACKVA